MTAAALAALAEGVKTVVSAAIDVDPSTMGKGGSRVRLLGIPIYDHGWAGVQRRIARRAARRAKADPFAEVDTAKERPSAKGKPS